MCKTVLPGNALCAGSIDASDSVTESQRCPCMHACAYVLTLLLPGIAEEQHEAATRFVTVRNGSTKCLRVCYEMWRYYMYSGECVQKRSSALVYHSFTLLQPHHHETVNRLNYTWNDLSSHTHGCATAFLKAPAHMHQLQKDMHV